MDVMMEQQALWAAQVAAATDLPEARLTTCLAAILLAHEPTSLRLDPPRRGGRGADQRAPTASMKKAGILSVWT